MLDISFAGLFNNVPAFIDLLAERVFWQARVATRARLRLFHPAHAGDRCSTGGTLQSAKMS
jgi:hypothetical protein